MRWAPVGFVLAATAGLTATYREWIDGSVAAYSVGVLLAVLTAALCAGWLESRGMPTVILVLAVAGAFMPTLAIHGVRLTNRTRPLTISLGSPLAHRAVVDAVVGREASAYASSEGLVLRVPSGTTGF